MRKQKIYIFYLSRDDAGYSFVALAEDGTCLSVWISPSEALAKGEATDHTRLNKYEKHYPRGYELVWRGGPVNPDTVPLQKPGAGGTIQLIEGHLYREFLLALTC